MIWKSVQAPIYDGLIADGKLSGWGWLQHSVGGEYRRLFKLRGADQASVLEAWGDAVNQMGENYEAETKELNEICYTHQDYIWDIAHRKWSWAIELGLEWARPEGAGRRCHRASPARCTSGMASRGDSSGPLTLSLSLRWSVLEADRRS